MSLSSVLSDNLGCLQMVQQFFKNESESFFSCPNVEVPIVIKVGKIVSFHSRFLGRSDAIAYLCSSATTRPYPDTVHRDEGFDRHVRSAMRHPRGLAPDRQCVQKRSGFCHLALARFAHVASIPTARPLAGRPRSEVFVPRNARPRCAIEATMRLR